MPPQNTKDSLLIENLGAINEFRVPSGWELVQHKEKAYGYTYQWSRIDQPEVTLSLKYSGHPLLEDDATVVNAIFLAPPHLLTPAELKSAREVLREQSAPEVFTISAAETKALGIRNVLCVTGRFVRERLDANTIFIDAEDTGRVIQEVAYRAPAELFERYLSDASLAWSSLALKQTGGTK